MAKRIQIFKSLPHELEYVLGSRIGNVVSHGLDMCISNKLIYFDNSSFILKQRLMFILDRALQHD